MRGSDRDAPVVLPLAITLAIQAMTAMASVTVPVLAPVASADTGIALNYIGVFMAIFYVGGMVSSLASGDFILRYGPIRVSQICLIFCGIGLAATAVGSLPLMILGALLIGIGYGPVTPASSHLLAKTTSPHLMSLTFSIKQTGVPMGGAMAGALVPPLVLSLGWKWASIVVGGVCILLAVLAETSRGTLDTDLQKFRRLSFAGITDSLGLVYSLPPVRELAVMSFFFAAMQVCLSTYFVSFLTTTLDVTLVQAGLTLTVALTAGMVGRIVWGGIADRLVAPRKMLGVLGIVMAVSAAATFAFSHSWPYTAILAVSAFFGASAVGWNGVYLAEVVRQAPPGKAGTATGGTLFFTFFGGVIGPPLFGVLAGAGHRYSLAYLMFAAPIFFLGLLLIWGRGNRCPALRIPWGEKRKGKKPGESTVRSSIGP
ncbi:MAG: MFS transporter [Desulfobacteria bacterium]